MNEPTTERDQSHQPAVAANPVQPDLRFFLPPGAPLPTKQWQRRWKVGIRIGSIVMAVLFVVAAGVAIVVGTISSSHFTATGAVKVDCATKSRPFSKIGLGSPVRIVDATSGELYGSTTLDDFTELKSGICLVAFKVPDVPVANLYSVEIGDDFQSLASAASLQGGALLS